MRARIGFGSPRFLRSVRAQTSTPACARPGFRKARSKNVRRAAEADAEPEAAGFASAVQVRSRAEWTHATLHHGTRCVLLELQAVVRLENHLSRLRRNVPAQTVKQCSRRRSVAIAIRRQATLVRFGWSRTFTEAKMNAYLPCQCEQKTRRARVRVYVRACVCVALRRRREASMLGRGEAHDHADKHGDGSKDRLGKRLGADIRPQQRLRTGGWARSDVPARRKA